MEVYLNITSPVLKRDGSIMTETELNAYLKRIAKRLGVPAREQGGSSVYSRVPQYVGNLVKQYLIEQGYDGIIMKDKNKTGKTARLLCFMKTITNC
jgi:hypothetical protein